LCIAISPSAPIELKSRPTSPVYNPRRVFSRGFLFKERGLAFRRVFVSLFLAALSVAPVSGCKKKAAESPKTAPKSVIVQPVARGPIRSTFTVSATLEPQINVRISSQVSGQIMDLPVNEGSEAKTGQPLALIDSRNFITQLNQLQADLVGKRAAFEKLKRLARPQEIAQLEARLKSAKEALDSAEKNLERANALFDAGVISLSEVEKARTAKEAAQAAFTDAEEALSLAREGAREEDLIAAEAAVKAIEARMEEVKLLVEKCTISAPIDGVVAKVYVNPSETVQPGTPICDFVNLQYMQAKIGLSENDLVLVPPGSRVLVRLKLAPDQPLPGIVTAISPNIDPETGTYTVEVTVPNPGGQLLGGFFADFEFTRAFAPDALVVPSDALVKEGDKWFAYVVTGGAVDKREVKTGIVAPTHMQVTEGLSENELLVIIGQRLLSDGDLVDIKETRDPSLPEIPGAPQQTAPEAPTAEPEQPRTAKSPESEIDPENNQKEIGGEGKANGR